MSGDAGRGFAERFGGAVPRSVRIEFAALAACWAASLAMFAWFWRAYGFSAASPALGVSLGAVIGLSAIPKLAGMAERSVTEWAQINRRAFCLFMLGLTMMAALTLASPAVACLAFPVYLAGLWRLDKPRAAAKRGVP